VEKTRVLCWSERTEPASIYPSGINGAIAESLNKHKDILAKTASITGPEQGLAVAALKDADVLIWWGHAKHGEVRDDLVERVVKRVRNDGMGFIPVHSAHYSKPFKVLTGKPCDLGGWREKGEWERVKVMAPKHPIAKGISDFTIPHDEMYKEPFVIPEPEALIFQSTFEGGEWFRSGVTFTFGKGRVFYFRPGHETYPVMMDPNVQKVLYNGVLWAARRT